MWRIGIVLIAAALASCTRPRSAEKLCEQASRIGSATQLVKNLGRPSRVSFGDNVPGGGPVEWWGYDGFDGVCIVTVAKNSVAPDPAYLAFR